MTVDHGDSDRECVSVLTQCVTVRSDRVCSAAASDRVCSAAVEHGDSAAVVCARLLPSCAYLCAH